MFKKLLGSISISGVLSALGAYFIAHVDPTIAAVAGAVIGVLTHQTVHSATGGQ